ncbi:MAG TPA: hypothetical protein VJB70_04520 [Candidatus Paceibacterota bacterium]
MLYLFFGNDTTKRNASAQKIIAGLQKKDANLLVHDIEAGQFSLDGCREHAFSQGFFGGTSAVVCRDVLGGDANEDIFSKCAEDLAASKNHFIFVETKKPKSLPLFKKHAVEVAEHSLGSKKKEDTSLFALSDAIARKDKKNAWIFFQKTRFTEATPEQVHGLIFWQTKNMLMVKQAEHNKEEDALPLSPFVLGKAKTFSKKHSLKELQILSSFLVGMYHESHMGGEELGASLERFILEMK